MRPIPSAPLAEPIGTVSQIAKPRKRNGKDWASMNVRVLRKGITK